MKNENKKENKLQKKWQDLKNTRKNYRKVRSSPYATLVFALKARKVIIAILIPYIIYRGVIMVMDYSARGFMSTFGRGIMIFIFAFLIYKIWKTIPQAQKEIEYYKKYPHAINYCPTDTREDIDDILNKIKENQKAKKEVEEKDVPKERKETRTPETSGS